VPQSTIFQTIIKYSISKYHFFSRITAVLLSQEYEKAWLTFFGPLSTIHQCGTTVTNTNGRIRMVTFLKQDSQNDKMQKHTCHIFPLISWKIASSVFTEKSGGDLYAGLKICHQLSSLLDVFRPQRYRINLYADRLICGNIRIKCTPGSTIRHYKSGNHTIYIIFTPLSPSPNTLTPTPRTKITNITSH